MKIIYICHRCGAEISRPIKENEIILSGTVLCDCGAEIIQFKVQEE